MTATLRLTVDRNDLASKFGRYCNSAMAWRMRFAVSDCVERWPLRYRETVVRDTLAAFATSSIVEIAYTPWNRFHLTKKHLRQDPVQFLLVQKIFISAQANGRGFPKVWNIRAIHRRSSGTSEGQCRSSKQPFSPCQTCPVPKADSLRPRQPRSTNFSG